MKPATSRARPVWLIASALQFQACTKEATEPGAPPPECEPAAAEPSRPYVRVGHRSAPGTCEPSRPCTPIRPSFFCSSHSECAEGNNGRCSSDGVECTYDECFVDEDCQPGALCDCAGGRDTSHRCLPVECRSDRDCTGGMGCSPSPAVECPVPVVGYYCHTAADECAVDGDCSGPLAYCAFNPSSRAWVCATQTCER